VEIDPASNSWQRRAAGLNIPPIKQRGGRMKLYYSENLNPRVAVAVARHLKSPVAYERASPRDPRQQDAFRAINPNTLVPVLVDGTDRLWETDAIACKLSRLAESDFWRTDSSAPEMIMWISWGTHHLSSAASILYWQNFIRPTYLKETRDPAEVERGLREFREHAAILDAELAGRTWLVGDHVSYADFRVATALPFTQRAGLPTAEFAHMTRWHDQLLTLHAWRAPFDGLA
jgi:glutathione S-transferase